MIGSRKKASSPELFIKYTDTPKFFPKPKNIFKPKDMSVYFPLRAGRSHRIGFFAACSWYTHTASQAAASPLQQSRSVNNPGF
jgi:hypothetical protein